MHARKVATYPLIGHLLPHTLALNLFGSGKANPLGRKT